MKGRAMKKIVIVIAIMFFAAVSSAQAGGAWESKFSVQPKRGGGFEQKYEEKYPQATWRGVAKDIGMGAAYEAAGYRSAGGYGGCGPRGCPRNFSNWNYPDDHLFVPGRPIIIYDGHPKVLSTGEYGYDCRGNTTITPRVYSY